MGFHSIALFFHIVGGLGIFIALGLEWTGLQKIRSTSLPEQAHDWIEVLKSARRLLFVSMLISALTGIISMLLEDGLEAWITVTPGSFFLMIVLVKAFTDSRMAAIERFLETEKGLVSQTIQILASHRLLWISIQTSMAIALGIVFLMTSKPDSGGSLLTIGITTVFSVIAYALAGDRSSIKRVQFKPTGLP